jgi:hypothetical protein
MPESTKAKITVEIPLYLKQWIEAHDLGQNALITLGLRHLYKQEENSTGEHMMNELLKELRARKLPF